MSTALGRTYNMVFMWLDLQTCIKQKYKMRVRSPLSNSPNLIPTSYEYLCKFNLIRRLEKVGYIFQKKLATTVLEMTPETLCNYSNFSSISFADLSEVKT